jgi:hypothetical protein
LQFTFRVLFNPFAFETDGLTRDDDRFLIQVNRNFVLLVRDYVDFPVKFDSIKKHMSCDLRFTFGGRRARPDDKMSDGMLAPPHFIDCEGDHVLTETGIRLVLKYPNDGLEEGRLQRECLYRCSDADLLPNTAWHSLGFR